MSISKILGVFFPKRCPYCRAIIKEDEYACADCVSDFPEEPMRFRVVGGFPCVASFPYDGAYRRAMLKFKFGNKKQYGSAFAVSIANDIKKEYNNIKFDCITCVPLHKTRMRERGYNQAEVLAENISALLKIEYADLLIKHRFNRPQHNLSGKERAKNVRGVYKTDNAFDVKGKTVLLCDDIVTTGHTLGECCKTLDKAGAKMIYCAAVMKR